VHGSTWNKTSMADHLQGSDSDAAGACESDAATGGSESFCISHAPVVREYKV
jgi:hypothetical protein